MSTLNLELAYTLPPVREAWVAHEPLPQDWLPALIEAIHAHLASPPSFDLAARMNEHLGDESTYEMKGQLIEGLKAIYSVMMDPKTSPDHKSSMAFKLIERAEHCTPGFHNGVNSLVDGLVRPASLDELLYRIRHDIVSKIANQTTHEVHSNNRFYTVAQNVGYGVRALNPDDVYTGDIADATIHQKLQEAFARDYRLFAVLSGMEEQIRSELLRLEYTGAREAGYDSARMERFLDFLTTLFIDAPAVIKQREAIALHQEYEQRIHDVMDSMRPAVRALIPALPNENLVDALIRDKFPEFLKAKYIDGLDDKTNAQIAKIQCDYEQVLGSEDMKVLAARTNASTDDRVSPFQLIEGGNLHLNWNQIGQTLWEEFLKQRYFSLTEEEKIAFNGLLGNSQPLKSDDCDVLALCGAEVMALLSLSMLSDDKKKGLLHWYIRDAQESLEDKLNNLPAIQNLGKQDDAIHAVLDELEAHLSALKEGMKRDWLHKLHHASVFKKPSLPRFLREDKAFMLAAMDQDPYPWVSAQASKVLFADRAFVLAAVKRCGLALEHASAEFKADREIVFAAVSQTGEAIRYSHITLKADQAIVLAAVSQSHLAFQYASNALKADRAFMLAAISRHGAALQYAPNSLQVDREFILAAVRLNGNALQYASAALKARGDFVLAAVRLNGMALQYAPAALKGDWETALAAVCQNGAALCYASAQLQADREFVLAAVRQNAGAFQFAPAALKQDAEIILATELSSASLEEPEAARNPLDIKANFNYGFFGKKPTSHLTAGQIERINAHLQTLGQELKASPDETIKRQKKDDITALQTLKALSKTMDVVSALQRMEDEGLCKHADAYEGSQTQELMDEIRGEYSSRPLRK